jgi:hypothetical protein
MQTSDRSSYSCKVTAKKNTQVAADIILHEGVLPKKNVKLDRQHLLVVPSIIRHDILYEFHDSPNVGHHGINFQKTVPLILVEKIKKRPTEMLCPIHPPKDVFEMVVVDNLGPFKKTGNEIQHAIVCSDYLTRWIEVKAVKDTGTVESGDCFFKENNASPSHSGLRRTYKD